MEAVSIAVRGVQQKAKTDAAFAGVLGMELGVLALAVLGAVCVCGIFVCDMIAARRRLSRAKEAQQAENAVETEAIENGELETAEAGGALSGSDDSDFAPEKTDKTTKKRQVKFKRQRKQSG